MFVAQDLGVLGVRVKDVRAIRARDGVGVDAEPVEVRGVEVEAKGGDGGEERVPLLRRVAKIARRQGRCQPTMGQFSIIRRTPFWPA